MIDAGGENFSAEGENFTVTTEPHDLARCATPSRATG